VGGAIGVTVGGLSVAWTGAYTTAILLTIAVALLGGLTQLAIPAARSTE
jgi:hypothetical protein